MFIPSNTIRSQLLTVSNLAMNTIYTVIYKLTLLWYNIFMAPIINYIVSPIIYTINYTIQQLPFYNNITQWIHTIYSYIYSIAYSLLHSMTDATGTRISNISMLEYHTSDTSPVTINNLSNTMQHNTLHSNNNTQSSSLLLSPINIKHTVDRRTTVINQILNTTSNVDIDDLNDLTQLIDTQHKLVKQLNCDKLQLNQKIDSLLDSINSSVTDNYQSIHNPSDNSSQWDESMRYESIPVVHMQPSSIHQQKKNKKNRNKRR